MRNSLKIKSKTVENLSEGPYLHRVGEWVSYKD